MGEEHSTWLQHPVVLIHTFGLPLICLHGQHGFIDNDIKRIVIIGQLHGISLLKGN